jgi:hypothetical protein
VAGWIAWQGNIAPGLEPALIISEYRKLITHGLFNAPGEDDKDER